VVGDVHPRGSMSLVNVAYAPALTWAHLGAASLEEQALVPLLGIDPIIELGLLDHEQEFFDMLRADATYQRLFPQAFPGEPVSLKTVTKALAAFERSIVSLRSPYDRYKFGGDASAISAQAKRGEVLFEAKGCAQCHGGWNFSAARAEGEPENGGSGLFFNTGLTYEAPNRGLYESSGRFDDFGRFRVPTLRNIAVTDPYMHDGSLASLEEVIDHYATGGGFSQTNRTPLLRPFSITDAEKDDLVEFLKTLTDQQVLHDAQWSNPWPNPQR
jgi:cytochrome c peroxidase